MDEDQQDMHEDMEAATQAEMVASAVANKVRRISS